MLFGRCQRGAVSLSLSLSLEMRQPSHKSHRLACFNGMSLTLHSVMCLPAISYNFCEKNKKMLYRYHNLPHGAKTQHLIVQCLLLICVVQILQFAIKSLHLYPCPSRLLMRFLCRMPSRPRSAGAAISPPPPRPRLLPQPPSPWQVPMATPSSAVPGLRALLLCAVSIHNNRTAQLYFCILAISAPLLFRDRFDKSVLSLVYTWASE